MRHLDMVARRVQLHLEDVVFVRNWNPRWVEMVSYIAHLGSVHTRNFVALSCRISQAKPTEAISGLLHALEQLPFSIPTFGSLLQMHDAQPVWHVVHMLCCIMTLLQTCTIGTSGT